MTTIQDRIIKDFKEKFGKYKYLCRYSDDFKKGEWKNLDEVKQFLIQSIKEVQEETRKEIFEKVGEIVGNEEISLSNNEVDKIWKECVNAERFRIGHSIFLLKQSLSITNKEKQK